MITNSKLPENNDLCELTDRERDVFVEMTGDLPNAELAIRLHLTGKSLENYKTRIGCKLRMPGRDVLNRFARRYAVEIREWYQLMTGKLRWSRFAGQSSCLTWLHHGKNSNPVGSAPKV